MGRVVHLQSVLLVNDDDDGYLSSVSDVAEVDVRSLVGATILVNRVVDGVDGLAAELDLGTLSDLDTIVEAAVDGLAGNNITVAAVGDMDPLTKASLSIAVPASATFDTVIEATTGGVAGNSLRIRTVADGAGVGSMTRAGNDFTFHYATGVTTVANFETAVTNLAGGDDLIGVKTAGTGANLLADPADTFAFTNLAGGLDSEGVTIEEVGNAVTIHYATGESTVANVEAAITADSTLLAVKTAGTGATVLTAPDDEFAATNLAGGSDEGGVAILVEKTMDGVNYMPVATVDEDDFAAGAGVGFAIALEDSNGMPLRARSIRATVVTLGETSKFSLGVSGTSIT